MLPDLFKARALAWANRFDTAFYLDSNNYSADHLAKYECIIAVCKHPTTALSHYGSPAQTASNANIFEQLHRYWQTQQSWLFGFLGYDLKNEIENLSTAHSDALHLPDLYFVVPDLVITLSKSNEVAIWHNAKQYPHFDAREIWEQIAQTPPIAMGQHPKVAIDLQNRLSPDEYINKVKHLLQHIQRGDIYEVNFCQEFYATTSLPIAPTSAAYSANMAAYFWQLNQHAQAPMSAYLKLPDNKYVLCASPERFMQKRGNKVWSQPIKGTIKRGTTPQADEALKQQLYNDPKERAENVMIVDLVRNDLTRSAIYGTVKVEELFGVYSFQTVHHLISTITAQINPQCNFADVLHRAFPMGSMTGAPKVRAMQLIDQYETQRRGLFSGAIGYITPQADFDFNVVIRTLLHNSDTAYWSLQTGGAITANAQPEQEYQESLLKASIIRRLFAQ